MAHTRISRKQWRALNEIRTQHEERPAFPPQPYPWGIHHTTWSSLERNGLIIFTYRLEVCHVRLSPGGHLALRHHEPTR